MIGLTAFLRERGLSDEDILDHVTRLAPPGQRQHSRYFGLRQAWPLLNVETLAGREDSVEGLLEVSAGKQLATTPAADCDYWFSVGKSGFRRLHRRGGCHVDTARDVREAVGVDTFDGLVVDARCKLCWPGEDQQEAAEEGEVGSASESSSSSTARSLNGSDAAFRAILASESD